MSSESSELICYIRVIPRKILMGQWLELLAADTHGKLGALRRSRQRAQRAYKEEHERCATLSAPPLPPLCLILVRHDPSAFAS